ncbi:sigma factor-like helix-turn-helix DNA-binding protein, partial [Halomonas sp. SIMBA_159]
AWLCTILRNEFYGRRRKKTEAEDPEGTLVAAMAVPASQEHRISLTELQRALDRLPDDQREALILVGASGFSYEEAA